MKKDKNIPGKSKAIRCTEGKITVRNINKANNFLGLRPYFSFTIRKSNQRKNGSKAINEKRNENLQIEKVKNLGASENASDENQRLL